MSSESPPGRTAKLSVNRKVRQLKTLFSAFRTENLECAGRMQWRQRF